MRVNVAMLRHFCTFARPQKNLKKFRMIDILHSIRFSGASIFSLHGNARASMNDGVSQS